MIKSSFKVVNNQTLNDMAHYEISMLEDGQVRVRWFRSDLCISVRKGRCFNVSAGGSISPRAYKDLRYQRPLLMYFWSPSGSAMDVFATPLISTPDMLASVLIFKDEELHTLYVRDPELLLPIVTLVGHKLPLTMLRPPA